jgi:hypothetical protein
VKRNRQNKLFNRALAKDEDFERWREHDRYFKAGMVVKVFRRKAPIQLIQKVYLAQRLGVWFEAQSILGGPTFLCATDQFKFLLSEMEALARCAKD